MRVVDRDAELECCRELAAHEQGVRKQNGVTMCPLRVRFRLTLENAALDDAVLELVEADPPVAEIARADLELRQSSQRADVATEV
jgi:hypothetical protein